MGALTIRQYAVAFTDLENNRLEHLRRLATAHLYEPAILRLRREADERVARLDAGDPGDGLADRVRQHTSTTTALADALNSARRNPLLVDVKQAAATRLYDTLLKGRTSARRSAPKRIEDTAHARNARPRLQPDLALFPAAPGEPSLADLVDFWLALGADIERVYTARTSPADEVTRTDREVVREAAALVKKVRKAIRVEVGSNPALPANLEAQVLGFIDGVVADKARRPKKAAAKKAAAEPA
jgi:hypothetical protein